MSASSATPRWPAWGHDRRWAWRLKSLKPLRTVTEQYLRSGELHAVVLLDSDLKLYKVERVQKLSRAGLFGWRPGYRGTYLRVEPVLRLERQLTLHAAKRYVLEFLSSHSDVYGTAMPRSELASTLMAAQSAEELFAVL